MIVTNKNSWLSLVVAVQGSTIVNIWPRIAFVVLLSIAVAAFSQAKLLNFSITAVPFTVVGLALAIFLGFRNNAAYDRYWEGRKLWGSLVNVSRNFCLQTRLIKNDCQHSSLSRERFVYYIIAYVNCFRHRLRKTDAKPELHQYIKDEVQIEKFLSHQNVPLAILDRVTESLVAQWNNGNIESYHLAALQRNVERLLDVQGGCERIQSTPIPFTYSVLTHRTVMIYCLALPFGFHDVVGWSLPFLTGFISYAFLALDDLADEIEQPFGLLPNSLPLHSISRNIEINLLQLIEDKYLPAPIVAENDLLM